MIEDKVFKYESLYSDVEELKTLVQNHTVKIINLNTNNPNWEECFLYIEFSSDSDWMYIMYIWPTSWPTFKSRKDGYVLYSNSVYSLIESVLEVEKSVSFI